MPFDTEHRPRPILLLESFTRCQAELETLLPSHWRELALDTNKAEARLAPVWGEYHRRDALDQLVFATVRHEGGLAGYFITFVQPGLHYAYCLTAMTDIFWLKPEFRTGLIGSRLFSFVERELRRRGVHRWFVGSKEHLDCSALLRRKGFTLIESHYSKWLGE